MQIEGPRPPISNMLTFEIDGSRVAARGREGFSRLFEPMFQLRPRFRHLNHRQPLSCSSEGRPLRHAAELSPDETIVRFRKRPPELFLPPAATRALPIWAVVLSRLRVSR